MTKRLTQCLSLGLLLSTTGACFGDDMAHQAQGLFNPLEWQAASDTLLDTLRGGFEDPGSGLRVAFGIVRTVTINGELVSHASFNISDTGGVNSGQSGVNVIQNGAGNFIGPGIPSALVNGTLIQNSLSDQTIQTLTVINAGVNSPGLLRDINAQSALQDALLDSVTKINR